MGTAGGFEERRDARIEAQRGKAFKKAEIEWDWNERGNFTRKYAHSINMFAMQAFHLDEGVAEANAALRELFEHYLAHETDLYEAHSFHWSGALYSRLWSFFSGEVRLRQGFGATSSRLEAETRNLMKQMMFAWSKKASIDLRADTDRIWRFANSENHHAMGLVTTWFFCGVLKDDPEYASKALEDGRTAGEHYAMWSAFLKEYFRSRAGKGQTVEIVSKNYNAHTIQMWYSVYDFAEDDELSRMAGDFLDLYWATWAEEQIDGVRGGGKTRIYQGAGSRTAAGGEVQAMGELYLGRDDDRMSSTDWTVVTSGYRMPECVVALALDVEGRGCYEVVQRCMGLAEPGLEREQNSPVVPFTYNGLREDFGGFLRYSYCTPEFVIGTLMCEARPIKDWIGAATQNRWQGVIFRGHPDAAIIPECMAVDSHLSTLGLPNTNNQHWSVQKKGTLITQKLETGRFSYQTGESRVWMSGKGLSEPVERDGWVFVESDGAYAGVRVVGEYAWDESDPEEGRWLRCVDDLSAIVIEVGRKAEYASVEGFQEAVVGTEMKVEDGEVRYQGLSGDRFTLNTDYSSVPEVNGEAVNYAPQYVYDSPHVRSEWDSGVVTVGYGGDEKVLDFNVE